MSIVIEITGTDAVLKKLGQFEGLKALVPAMQDATEYVQSYLADEHVPPVTTGGWVKLMTPKARRWFWANFTEGRLNFPYRRSGQLGRSWKTKVSRTGGGLEGIIGTNLKYAKYVQNLPDQAMIHINRWQTVQDIAKSSFIIRNIQAIFDRAINRLLA